MGRILARYHVITESETMTTPQPYIPDLSKPPAFLVDIDGTVALMHDRSPYDETRVSTDAPNYPVITVVRVLASVGYRPIFLSGRTAGCAQDTAEWIYRHVFAYNRPGCMDTQVYMRDIGDTRPDSVVKLELFDKYIRHHYNVLLSLDDRNRVVALWRSLGITCLQVAEGDF